ncbi:MAG: DUF1638 domain-containing protein, partial [Spirochaetaceae bacterium]|nr:DUF1638 domain-containing protein [Spirochaetaceae bacterium]
ALGSGPGARMTRAAKRMFDRYERALMILTPAMTEDEMRHGAEPFARELGLRLDTRQGSLEILFSSWQSAKASLPTEAEPPVLGSES